MENDKPKSKRAGRLASVPLTVWAILISAGLVLGAGVIISNTLTYSPTVSAAQAAITSTLGTNPAFTVGTPVAFSVSLGSTGGHTGSASVNVTVSASGVACSEVSLSGSDAGTGGCLQGVGFISWVSAAKSVISGTSWSLSLTYNVVVAGSTIAIALTQ